MGSAEGVKAAFFLRTGDSQGFSAVFLLHGLPLSSWGRFVKDIAN